MLEVLTRDPGPKLTYKPVRPVKLERSPVDRSDTPLRPANGSFV
jgi:hypothetical protein